MIKAKHLMLMVGAMAMVLATAPLAKAVQILDIDVNDDYYLGSIDPSQPAKEADQASYINYLITLDPNTSVLFDTRTYTRSGNSTAGLPDASATDSFKDESSTPAQPINFGWDYVLGKYGTASHVWYIAELWENFTIPTSITVDRGLSHYTLFNSREVPVPDGGKTLLLLGLGLAGMIGLRRRMEA